MQGDVLWQEILRNPDDDGPRLVYADWLEQTGDPEQQARGALIHAQLALEALPRSAKAARAPYDEQVRAVMKKWRRRWLGPLGKLSQARWTFRRGFLDGGELPATTFAAESQVIFEHAPLARTFRFPEASNELIGLVEIADFARVVHADLTTMCSCGHCPIENELPHLFASPYAANLRTLSLADCRIDDTNATRLAESAILPKLVALDLSKNRISEHGARALAAALAPHAKIDLRKNEISKVSAKQLRTELGARAKL